MLNIRGYSLNCNFIFNYSNKNKILPNFYRILTVSNRNYNNSPKSVHKLTAKYKKNQ